MPSTIASCYPAPACCHSTHLLCLHLTCHSPRLDRKTGGQPGDAGGDAPLDGEDGTRVATGQLHLELPEGYMMATGRDNLFEMVEVKKAVKKIKAINPGVS